MSRRTGAQGTPVVASVVADGLVDTVIDHHANVLPHNLVLGRIVAVPIDEKRALTLKVSPTYVLDTVNSVTLKAFRKIVGYDTFESIRRKSRDEQKDISDYYNVTVSIMVRRRPADVSPIPKRDPYSPDGPASLASTLDKGFPYDD